MAQANDQNLLLVPWMIGLANGQGIVSTIATIDWTSKISGVSACFSGSWYQESGTVHLFIPCSISGVFNMQVYETHALDGTLMTWSDPALITVTGKTDITDPKVWKIGATYYMWLQDQTARYLELASASTLLGPYTMQRTGDWAGWGTNMEGPTMYSTGATSWRLAMEHILTSPEHRMFYSDCNTLDLLSCTWTAVQPWHEDQDYRHGSILK